MMPNFEDLERLPEGFSEKVRLFPLPNLVLFPHVMQPLHVVESRHLALLEDALAGDRLIALAILLPGWEQDYEGSPPLHGVACLGRIASHCRLEDGTYNVLLLGLHRVRLLKEGQGAGGFRTAEVEVCDDQVSPQETCARAALHAELRRAFLRILPMLPDAQEQLDQLLRSDVSLAVLTDVISYLLPIPVADKQALLAEVNVHRRAELLLTHLTAATSPQAADQLPANCFPPLFSAN